MKRAWKSASVLQIIQIISGKIAFAYVYQATKFGGLMSCGSKSMFKNASSFTNTHRDVIDLINRGMVKITKT